MSHCIAPLLERKGLQITILDQLLRLIAVYKRECVCTCMPENASLPLTHYCRLKNKHAFKWYYELPMMYCSHISLFSAKCDNNAIC